MSGPLLALRGAIYDRLVADATLAGLMGGSVRLHDEPPRAAAPVYAVFGAAEARDASVDLAGRHAHEVAITVWARPGGARGAIEAAERIADLLDDAPLAPVGQHLVLARVTGVAAVRDERTNATRATVTLTATTELL